MRDKQNNPVENSRSKNEGRQTEISSEKIRNAHASGDGSLSRNDLSYPEKNDRFNSEEEHEQEQNY